MLLVKSEGRNKQGAPQVATGSAAIDGQTPPPTATGERLAAGSHYY